MIFWWVALYGLLHTFVMNRAQWIIASVMMLYTLFFLIWICWSGQKDNIGLNVIQEFGVKDSLYLFPLSLLPICNLMIGKDGCIDFWSSIFIMSVAIIEELFFRGFMLHFFVRQSRMLGVLLTSIIFALFHCVNLIQNDDHIYVFLQVICAFSVGLCFAATTIKYNSLIPCLVVHFLINVTGIINPISVGNSKEVCGLWICIAVYLFYAVFLYKEIQE